MSNQDETMEMDSELDAAMALLSEEVESDEDFSSDLPDEELASPTLTDLEEARRPKTQIACQMCPNSMWLSSPEEVKCYCRIMHTISYSATEPSLITKCDGVFLDGN